MTKMLSCLAVFFVLALFPDADHGTLSEGVESQQIWAVVDGDLGPAANPGFGLKRQPRMNFPAPSGIGHDGIAGQVQVDGLPIQTLNAPSSAKYSVYQRMNVYRL